MPELITISDAPVLKGPNAARMLEIANKLLVDGKKALALAWAVRAKKRADLEGNKDDKDRAEQIVKILRAEIQAKAGFNALSSTSGFGDAEGIKSKLESIDLKLVAAVNAVKEDDQAEAYDLVDDAWDEMREVLRQVWAYRVVRGEDYPGGTDEIKKRINKFVVLFLKVR